VTVINESKSDEFCQNPLNVLWSFVSLEISRVWRDFHSN